MPGSYAIELYADLVSVDLYTNVSPLSRHDHNIE